MPDCSRFQQIVNDRRAVADTLHANLNQDLADCAAVGRPCRFVFFVFFVLLPHYLLRCLEVFVSDQ